MRWVYYYGGLFLLFMAAVGYAIWHPGRVPTDLRLFASGVTMLSAMAQALARSNFRVYLFSQKIWLFFNRDATSLWRFSMRFDGGVPLDILDNIVDSLSKEIAPWTPRLVSRESTCLRVIIDKTIHLTFTLQEGASSEDGENHLFLRSDQLEVTYGSARKKIDSCIVPFMGVLNRKFAPHSSGCTLEVEFGAKNPFFTFFVAHLPQEQVTQFNLVFRPVAVTRSKSDRVLVTQRNITIDADSPETFAMLSKAFLLLTEDAVTMQTL